MSGVHEEDKDNENEKQDADEDDDNDDDGDDDDEEYGHLPREMNAVVLTVCRRIANEYW